MRRFKPSDCRASPAADSDRRPQVVTTGIENSTIDRILSAGVYLTAGRRGSLRSGAHGPAEDNGLALLHRTVFALGLLCCWTALSSVAPLHGQFRDPSKEPVILYVMDFDNIQAESRIEWLSIALRDMILLRLEDEPRVTARSADQVSPFLEGRTPRGTRSGPHMASNNLLLMGSYRRSGARILIDLQLLDLEDWSNLARERLEGRYSDMSGLNASLTAAVRALLRRVSFLSGFVLGEPGEGPSVAEIAPAMMTRGGRKFTPPDYAEQLPQVREGIMSALEDLEEAMDLSSGNRQEPQGTLQQGEAYVREFRLERHGSLPSVKVSNTALFEQVLREVARNPYAAEIGDLALEVDPLTGNSVLIRLPVAYRVKQALLEDMLYTLPYQSSREEGGLRAIRYDRRKFDFSADLLKRIAQGDFRVVPVLRIFDADQHLHALLIDSPDNSWERYFPGRKVKIIRQSRFVPLLAITTGGSNVDVRMETGGVQVIYEFDVAAEQLSAYAKVVVRFMREDELARYLQSL